MLSHPRRAITMYDIRSLSARAYYKAFTPTTIIAGFNKTKIYHINWYIFSDDISLSSALLDMTEPNVRAHDQSTGFQRLPPARDGSAQRKICHLANWSVVVVYPLP